MDRLSKEILKELLPAEKEVVPPPAAQARRENPAGRLDHWSLAILLERATYLRQLARHGDGQASETLKEYPQHAAMLSFRARDGQAELHENFADLFYVLEGRATLVTGGTIAGAQTIGPGEMRGASVEGGARQELRAGDLAHVPAGVPHQMLVAGEKTVTCFVLKVQENL
ncbi:MAG: cupin domain-containing protein [Terracidiphilus sp.]|jgi:mannose-6-phosphate isomerase-like protein (cupin superfamily)